MKRRRIREIVAAAVDARTRQRTDPREVTIDVERGAPIGACVTIDVGPWREGVHWGGSKVGALVSVLRWYVPGKWMWPARPGRDERVRAGRGQTLDVLDPSAELVHEDILDHLREPVALPQEARRG